MKVPYVQDDFSLVIMLILKIDLTLKWNAKRSVIVVINQKKRDLVKPVL